MVVGPALGAVLLAVSSAPMAFLANAGTFAISAVLISTLPASGHRADGSSRAAGRACSPACGRRTSRRS